MKKLVLIGMAVVVALAALGVAGVAYVYAQAPTPVPGFGPGGMMGGGRGRGGMGGPGMMGGYGQTGQPGPMHDYMEAAMAEALGMDQKDLEAELDAGKTMWQVAEAKGLTLEQFQTLMLDARKAALAKMVEDGVITQAQADFMLSRMQGGFGGGRGGGMGGGRGGCPGMGGGRWNTQPTQAPGGNS